MTGAEERFKRGDQAARKGNYEYAVELYLQGLTLNPRAAAERRRLHEYEAMAIESQGGNPQGGVGAKMKTMGTLAKAKKLSMQKKWDEVALELEKALKFQPRNTSILIQLAQALVNWGEEYVDGAMAVLEDVVAIDKHNVDALRKLGQLWAQKDDPEKAISYWERLKMVRPDDKEASKAIRDLSAATMVRKAEERKAEAGDDSFKALLKDEDESADLEQKAKVLRTDEDRKQAIQFKLAEIKKDPTNSRLWRDLGGLYQDLRSWKHALAAYKKALEVNPHDLFAHDKIGALKEQRMDEALEQVRTRIEAARQNGGDVAKLAEELSAAEKKNVQFKVEEYNRRVRAHPTDYELKLRYGRLLMEAGLYDQAIEQFQKSVKDPKFKVQSQNLMGQCFRTKGVHAVAVAQYKEALGNLADPDSDIGKEIRYNLAVASQEHGDHDTALRYFQEIMAADIGYRDVSGRVDEMMKES